MLMNAFAVRLILMHVKQLCHLPFPMGVTASRKRVDPILRGLSHPWKEQEVTEVVSLRKNDTKTTTKLCFLKP